MEEGVGSFGIWLLRGPGFSIQATPPVTVSIQGSLPGHDRRDSRFSPNGDDHHLGGLCGDLALQKPGSFNHWSGDRWRCHGSIERRDSEVPTTLVTTATATAVW
jgi:hypothetical protein